MAKRHGAFELQKDKNQILFQKVCLKQSAIGVMMQS